ncbi:M23 family metallopeptidase [Bacillus carboniphilus]|uniref:M23 family metallopeptidase n=1 Tax=Bacillus carboniphilus TaxID=86663 RepID=UPI003CD0B433
MRILMICTLIMSLFSSQTSASENANEVYTKRTELYLQIEAATLIPWYYIAAVDQYERNIRAVRRDLPKAEGLTGIYYEPAQWAGYLNPNQEDSNPLSISLFGGVGIDGNSDGKASRTDDFDILMTMAKHLQSYGSDDENLRIGLWDYYKRDKTVSIIMNFAKMYRHFGRLNLNDHHFPMPLRFNHTYHNTWGDARGWGGRRIHEGTDIFADYGVPVLATCYGVVEMKGWNRYGGWRVGIRDINNTYHYYAHLNGFAKDLHVGQIVEPGTVIGGVGSTGYGPPGTSGKFPPHLHYGMYKDNGRTEWSFDPYPHLRHWERITKNKR